MTLDEGEGILETIKNQKSFLKCYKISITIDFDVIDTSVEGLLVVL